MKKIVSAGLFISALSSAAFAVENKELCAAHIQKIQDTVSSSGNMSADIQNRAKSDLTSAKKAESDGDYKKCIDVTLQSLMKIRQYMN